MTLSKTSIQQRLAALAIFCAASVSAEPLPISDTPLFLSTAVTPNVFFEVDDSGSMDWEILTQKHWHFCAYDPSFASDENLGVDDDCGWQVDDGLWNTYNRNGNGNLVMPRDQYIYDNGDNAFSSDCDNTLESCESNFSINLGYQMDWRVFSAKFNMLYFDPTIDYEPWSGPCLTNGTACSDASFTAALSDPREGSTGYSVSRNLNNFMFEVWTDDKGYSGNRPRRGANTNSTNTANGEIDIWDSHTRYRVTGNTISVESISYAPSANGLNETITSSVQLTGSNCFSELYPSDPSRCRTIAETKQNIANWYQYHRKRSYVAKNAISSVVNNNPGYRYGLSVINRYSNLFVQVPAATTTSFASHNRNMLGDLFSLDWPTSSTPLRRGLERVGDYFDNALGSNFDDPIIGTCQKNFSILFTDGYWNGSNPSVQDEDGDGHSATLADVAKYYYDRDLSPLPNDVPTDPFDNNNQQHMVTFTVAFGVKGDLQDTDLPADGWPDDASGNNLTESSDWGNPSTMGPAKIDDLWHAAFNSRGTYVAASTATEVVDALEDALQSIQRRTASAASVALNSGIISSSSSIYLARFDSSDWSGELSAVSVDPVSGQVGNTSWEASQQLPPWNQRTILTHSGATVNNSGAAFRWNDLTTVQQDHLRAGLTGTSAQIDAAAQLRLQHLRGDDTEEQRNGGNLRDRLNSALGDIINSSPSYVAAPSFPYPDTLESTSTTNNYAAFRTSHANRTPMLYVGANDGMLHGFDASSGEEKIAYLPNAVFGNLSRLTDPNYSHRFYVDGSPTVGDAFFDPNTANGPNKSWRTVLVGGLNKGGQGIYALDITDPSSFDESTTATVLWEFSDANDHDIDGDGSDDALPAIGQSDPADSMRHALGDSFSRPAIVRLANGQWAAIFGNGYNNTRTDGAVSINGDAVLYILDIGTGEVIRKISTQTGSDEDPEAYLDANGNTVYRQRANGLATTAPVDENSDHIVDFVYAGDLFGNLWKFDLTSSNPADWGVAFLDTSNNPLPLYTACAGICSSGLNATHQPITTRPEVGRSADRYGMMIYFGTGKYLANSDIIDTSVQSFYGITDGGTRLVGSRNIILQQQSIDTETSISLNGNNYDIRTTSDTAVGNLNGWYLDLVSPVNGQEGERVVQTPVLRNNRIIFPTLIPAAGVCGLGGSSWLMELDAFNGGRLSTSPFDLDQDGVFDNYVSTGGGSTTNTPLSGTRHNEVISSPGILNADGKEFKYTSGSSGNVSVTVESPDPSAFNRQSWRQLR